MLNLAGTKLESVSMSIPSQIIQSFGFHTESSFTATPSRWTRNDNDSLFLISWKKQDLNVSNILGYLPVIGSITGVFRMRVSYREYGLKYNEAFKPFLVSHIVRGAMETIGLGIFLILVDLIVTAGRYIAEKCSRTERLTGVYSLNDLNQGRA